MDLHGQPHVCPGQQEGRPPGDHSRLPANPPPPPPASHDGRRKGRPINVDFATGPLAQGGGILAQPGPDLLTLIYFCNRPVWSRAQGSPSDPRRASRARVLVVLSASYLFHLPADVCVLCFLLSWSWALGECPPPPLPKEFSA